MQSSRPLPLRRLFTGLATLCVLLLAACDSDSASHNTSASSGALARAETSSSPAPAGNATVLPDPVPGPDGKVRLSDEEWHARLTPEQFKILRGADTERPFSCPLWKISEEPGVYHCAGCGLALFNSTDKFDSGTGWPSFSHPIAPDRIVEKSDNSYGMIRVESLCARCEGHLGHVFPDGPPPSGLRYCINGTALRFEPASAKKPATPAPKSESAPATKAQP
jgi:peptide-methionine (R)-S-oxide reductase